MQSATKSLRALVALAALALLFSACGEVQESQVLIRVEGSAQTITSAPPEATTSTTERQVQQVSDIPGVDPDECGAPGPEHTVFLTDVPTESPPCRVGAHQRLRFFNLSDETLEVRWGGDSLRIGSGESATNPTLIGDAVQTGLYRVQVSPATGPQIELVDPTDGLATTEIGLRSFGKLRPGQTLSVAEKSLDNTITIQSRADMSTCTLGWITGDPYSPLLSFEGDPVDPTLTRVEATTDSQRTFSGLGIGSTAEELRTAYGDQLTSGPGDAGVERYTFEPNDSRDQNFRLVFDTKQDVVTSVRIGSIGDVERPNPC